MLAVAAADETAPIVIVTGQDPEKYRTSAIAEGCDDFLIKPN